MYKTNRLSKGLMVLLITLLAVSIAFAGSDKRRGTAGAQELLLPVGSVGTAMGGSYSAVVSGIEAAYWNPAGVAKLEGNGEAIFSHMDYIADINVEYAAIASRVGNLGVLGASLKTINFGEIPVTTTNSPDGTGETYSPRYMTIGVIFSRVMTDRINFGAKLNLISEQIMRVSANGVALNAGVQYRTSEDGFMMGVTLRNLGIDMLFTGADLEQTITPPGSEPGTRSEPWRIPLSSFELPTQLEIAIAYGVYHNGSSKLTLGGSFLNDNFSLDQYTFGAELEVMDMFYLRGSYALAEDPETHELYSGNEEFLWGPGFGGGLKLKMGTTNLKIDYAMRPTYLFANTQWLSFRVGF
ncbi:MAG: PorV/PorQ family protein [Candidatus Marinimicrobia bacterium]|nr:PorV/PorQ family protein [Candidatus Neomarinimicrobiota bacterium]